MQTLTNLLVAMVAAACLVVACATQGVTTMANTNSSTTTIATTNKGTQRKLVQVTGTSPVAQQPAVHPVPTAPNSQPAANWHIAGQPSNGKRAVAGVGPCPAPTTVGYALLQALAQAGSAGCTMVQLQAAIAAQVAKQGLTGKHPAWPLMAWLAANRGYTFTCTNGQVVCSNAPSGL